MNYEKKSLITQSPIQIIMARDHPVLQGPALELRNLTLDKCTQYREQVSVNTYVIMAQLTPLKGFSHSPVTKVICIVSTVLAICFSVFQVKYLLRLIIDPYIITYSQYWRVLAYQLCVVNESDYLLTTMLWFHFKVLERFFGSRKYLSLLAMFAMLNALVCLTVLCFGQLTVNLIEKLLEPSSWEYHTTLFNKVSSGPVGILSSFYILFRHYIPSSYRFKLLISKPSSEGEEQTENVNEGSKELVLDDHLHVHIVFILIFLNNGFESVIPGVVGLLIGKLYYKNVIPGSLWVLPSSLYKCFVSPLEYFKSLSGHSRVAGPSEAP